MQIRFWLLVLFLTLFFSPVFTTHFGAHTDGYFFITSSNNWLGGPESIIMFKQGRPFSVFLNSFIAWHIKEVGDLTTLRFLIYCVKLLTMYLLYWFCLRIKINQTWALLMSACFVLLPSNIINVIWPCNGAPESMGLLFGVLSYVTLEKFKRYWGSALAAVLFLVGLLFYQPMAVIVFAFMFIRLLFDQRFPWNLLRNRIIKEIFFYGAVLVCYWLITKYIILSYAQSLNPTVVDSQYQMELVRNVFTKVPLVIDLVRYSLIGTWDLVLHNHHLYEWLMIAIFVLAMVLVFFRKVHIQKIALCFVLFLLANAPALMAVNYTTVGGYRTFLASALMGLGLTIYCFYNVKNKAAKFLAGIYFISVIGVGVWAIYQSVRNYSREYEYLDKMATQIDYKTTRKIILVVNRPGETVIEYDLPFEFGYMTTVAPHVRYIFDKHNRESRGLQYSETFLGFPLYIDDSTQVVDLTVLRGHDRITYATPANKISVSTSAENISIEQVNSANGSPALEFKQKESGECWQIKPGIPEGVVIYHFLDVPELVMGYRLKTGCVNAQEQSCNFSWLIQGSEDGNQWSNLSLQRWDASAPEYSFTIPEHFPLRYLRFIFRKEHVNDLVVLGAIQLKNYEVRK
jgi:hypothetical protein